MIIDSVNKNKSTRRAFTERGRGDIEARALGVGRREGLRGGGV